MKIRLLPFIVKILLVVLTAIGLGGLGFGAAYFILLPFKLPNSTLLALVFSAGIASTVLVLNCIVLMVFIPRVNIKKLRPESEKWRKNA